MNSIKFLGTAGARFVVMRQLRASGGLWLTLGDETLLVDPGPGTLVRCLKSRPRLDPKQLKGIILTHRHLDHTADVNIMIEAMTEGGFKKRGVLYAPSDALDEDPVVLQYLRGYVESIEVLREGRQYRIGDVLLETPLRHVHGVETYGLRFRLPSGRTVGFVTDTRYSPGLEEAYRVDVLVLNVVRYKSSEPHIIDHLSAEDAERILRAVQPDFGVLTHFGMTMLRAKPWKVAQKLEKRLKIPVVAARDGMTLDLGV